MNIPLEMRSAPWRASLELARLTARGRKAKHTWIRNGDIMKRRLLAIAAVSLAVVAVGVPADATTTNGTAAVSCSSGTWAGIKTVTHATTGAMTFWSNSTSPASTTNVKAQSGQGNWLNTRAVVTGSYGSWSGVVAETYDFYATRSVSFNCNGSLPGNGNFSLNFSIVH
jgi:hypothetical protein